LFVLLIYAVSEQPSLLHSTTVATTETSRPNENREVVQEMPEPAQRDEPAKGNAPARDSEPVSPAPPTLESQPQPTESPPKQSVQSPAAPHRNVPGGGTRRASRGSVPKPHASHPPVDQPGPAASLTQASTPTDSEPKDLGTGEQSAPWPD